MSVAVFDVMGWIIWDAYLHGSFEVNDVPINGAVVRDQALNALNTISVHARQVQSAAGSGNSVCKDLWGLMSAHRLRPENWRTCQREISYEEGKTGNKNEELHSGKCVETQI